jgi:hypothetical protein
MARLPGRGLPTESRGYPLACLVASQNNLRRNGFVRVHHLEQTEANKQPNEVSDALYNNRRKSRTC